METGVRAELALAGAGGAGTQMLGEPTILHRKFAAEISVAVNVGERPRVESMLQWLS